MLGLKPIQLLPARERVASALRKAILTRQISEGEVLTLDNTAKELGISITPVREAFQILARDGLIELKQNKGAVVLGINEHTLREHYQIRAVLEGASSNGVHSVYQRQFSACAPESSPVPRRQPKRRRRRHPPAPEVLCRAG